MRGSLDGLYFDVAFPKPCSNAEHGCTGSYTLLAQRDLRRRAACLFEQDGRQGLIFEHMSMNMYGPVMSFATVYLDGEQYYGRVHDDYRSVWTLGYLRAMSTGSNWGLIPQFLPMVTTKNEDEAKRASDSLVAMWTLHAPLHACIGWRAGPAHAPAYELDRAFGFTPDTTRLGYWENGHLVTAAPKDVKVTLYHKPGSLLAVASNLTDRTINASISLSMKSLGLPRARLARVLDNQPSAPTLEDGRLGCTIRPASCVMCILNGAAGGHARRQPGRPTDSRGETQRDTRTRDSVTRAGRRGDAQGVREDRP